MRYREPSLKDLDYVAELIKKHVHKDFDIVVAVCADEGMGKSTLAIQLAKKIDPEFSLKRNLIIDPNITNVTEKLYTLPPFTPIIWDEAIRVAYKLSWMDKRQIHLNKVYAICRKLNQVTISCMPSFADFNKFFRERRIKLWIQIVKRGYAVVFVRDWIPMLQDRWYMDENIKIIKRQLAHKSIADQDSDDKLNALRRCNNYAFEFAFPDLDAKEKEEYKEMNKEMEIYFEQADTKVNDERYKNYTKNAVYTLYTKYDMRVKTIAETLSMSTSTVNSLLRKAGVNASKFRYGK